MLIIKQVNNLLFIHPNIWKFEKVEVLQISRVHDLYRYIKHGNAIGYLKSRAVLWLAAQNKVLCDVISCVCPLIDHGSWPMKALEFLTLLYKVCCASLFLCWWFLQSCSKISRFFNQRFFKAHFHSGKFSAERNFMKYDWPTQMSRRKKIWSWKFSTFNNDIFGKFSIRGNFSWVEMGLYKRIMFIPQYLIDFRW
jgi:hypothetical protein